MRHWVRYHLPRGCETQALLESVPIPFSFKDKNFMFTPATDPVVLVTHALRMWANYIETGDVNLSAEDCHRMGVKEKDIDCDQATMVEHLRCLARDVPRDVNRGTVAGTYGDGSSGQYTIGAAIHSIAIARQAVLFSEEFTNVENELAESLLLEGLATVEAGVQKLRQAQMAMKGDGGK